MHAHVNPLEGWVTGFVDIGRRLSIQCWIHKYASSRIEAEYYRWPVLLVKVRWSLHSGR